MNTGRLEAFSDGVIAVALTVMVLGIPVPEETELSALYPLIPQFLTYILSFLYVGIYWSNHHHLMHAAERVNGTALWCNMHVLFWITLIPLTTAWMGRNYDAAWPTAIYGIVLLCAALAHYLFVHCLVCVHGQDSALAKAIGRDYKGKLSIVLYLAAIFLSFVHTVIPHILYFVVALMWLVPDRRIEKSLDASI